MPATTAIRDKLHQATETGRAKVAHFEHEAQKLVHKIVERGRDAQAVGLRRLEDLKPALQKRFESLSTGLRDLAKAQRKAVQESRARKANDAAGRKSAKKAK